jgi:hypothetical protein
LYDGTIRLATQETAAGVAGFVAPFGESLDIDRRFVVRLEGNGHVIVVREESAAVKGQIVDGGGLEPADLGEIREKERRQSRSAGRKEFGFG